MTEAALAQHRAERRIRLVDLGGQVAEVSKKWFRVRDTYGVEVVPGSNDALILAITVAIDSISH